MNQLQALKALLHSGNEYTIDQLIERVSEATGRPAKRKSIQVQISVLRTTGWKIVSFRGETTSYQRIH
jgi:hypothetical protein